MAYLRSRLSIVLFAYASILLFVSLVPFAQGASHSQRLAMLVSCDKYNGVHVHKGYNKPRQVCLIHHACEFLLYRQVVCLGTSNL